MPLESQRQKEEKEQREKEVKVMVALLVPVLCHFCFYSAWRALLCIRLIAGIPQSATLLCTVRMHVAWAKHQTE